MRSKTGTYMPTHNLSKHRFYPVWRAMMGRCYNANDKAYPRYGGRRISVLREWHDVQVFIEWLESNNYGKGLQIDRIDNDGDYCEDNCRVVTPSENSRNRRDNRKYLVKGEMLLPAEVEEKYGIKAETFRARIEQYGQTPDEALINRRKLPVFEWEIDGKMLSTKDIERRFGTTRQTFIRRVSRGWTAKRAAMTPVGG